MSNLLFSKWFKNFGVPLFLLFLMGCTTPEKTPISKPWVNTGHLNHLYEALSVHGDTLGIVWIYCEAPDYHLVADEDEGFTCVDDVARALVFYCREYQRSPAPEILEKIRAMTEFLLYMQSENGFFYNFLLPGPEINKTHQNSLAVANWWSWRAFWALSELNLLEEEGLADLQKKSRSTMEVLVQRMGLLCLNPDSTATFDGLEVPACFTDLGADQVGVILAGLANYFRVDPTEEIKDLMLSFGGLLLGMQQGDADTWPYGAFLSWRNLWHAWGNGQAYALLVAGRLLEEEAFIQAGLNEVAHFYPYFLEQGGMHAFKVSHESDSLFAVDYQSFPQIAYNIRPMVYASLEAYSITGDTTYAVTAGRLATWFFGNNPAGQAMYDPASGLTFDGISSQTEVNKNSGAESTIEALLSLQAVEAVPVAFQVVKAHFEERKN